MLGRMLGTHISAKTGKLSLVSTHISQGYSEAIGKTLIDIAKRVMEEKS
jgi:hypothetical protein